MDDPTQQAPPDPQQAAPPPQAPPGPQQPTQPAPQDSATGGEQFIPPNSQMAGPLGNHPMTDTPETEDDTQVSPEEQKQYDDLVVRAKLFINDPRPPLNSKGHPVPGAKAPRDVIIDHLNVPGQNAADSVGRTTAQVMWILYTNAKRQGYPYSPDVLYHGADEVMSDLYQIAVAAKLIKNPPAPDSQEEQHFLGLAKLSACKFFGQNLIDTGQSNQKEAQQYYLDQIKREGESGALDKWDPSQQFTPQQLSAFVNKAASGKAQFKGRQLPPSTIAQYANQGHPQLVPPGGASAPPPDDGSGAAPDDGSGDQGGGDQQQQGGQ
jgi:hypothetical protein